MAKETMGDRIKKTREQLGLSASDLARRTDVSPSAVANWETGTIPRPSTLADVAGVLRVTEDYLQHGTPMSDGEVSSMNRPKRSVDRILDDAAKEIAALMGVPPKDVSVDMSYNRNW